jgi:imidazolonepropionase-like amidohydrolase
VVLNGNKIAKLVPAGKDDSAYGTVIDGKKGYLTPGLIDAHWHCVLALPAGALLSTPTQYVAALAVWESKKLLMKGFTTLRDAGGNTVGLKRATDEGYVEGPRIYPAQAVLAQYSGHTDFRNPNLLPKEWSGQADPIEQIGLGILCNGEQQVIAATRNNLYQGATQIKICTSGGVISFTDPLYVYEFMEEEIRAAVRAAEDYGTYVMAHCHSAGPMKRSMKAGVKTLEHISQADEDAMKMAGDLGVHVTVSALTAKNIAETYPKGDPRQVKGQMAWDNTKRVMEWVEKYDVHLSHGTDLLDSWENREMILPDMTCRKNFFSSSEIMIQTTGNPGATVALSGQRNPYGKVGVIEEDAMADLLIYNKNPLDDVAICEDYENNLKLVVKDGKVYKNTL